MWNPIETAPKNGQWIWVWRQKEPTISQFDSIHITAFKWDASREMWFAGTGWWHGFPMKYTHWAPMPEQPEPMEEH